MAIALSSAISADARAAWEVLERMKETRAPLLDEPPLPAWQDERWAESRPLPDRCPILGLAPPIGPEAAVIEEAEAQKPAGMKGRDDLPEGFRLQGSGDTPISGA